LAAVAFVVASLAGPEARAASGGLNGIATVNSFVTINSNTGTISGLSGAGITGAGGLPDILIRSALPNWKISKCSEKNRANPMIRNAPYGKTPA
jgi:hypothetical protein